MDLTQTRTWAEISLENIKHNYLAIRARLPAGTRFLGVVKADAYGHGAIEVSELLEGLGCECLAVACVEEAAARAKPGDTVLLSPACASWDMYRCFEDRGDDFRSCVERLDEGGAE